MKDVAYEMWADYIEEICQRHRFRPDTVLDVACGTGNSTIPFALRGYRMAGVDGSQPMLDVARAKAAARGLDIEFARQDMRDLRPAELKLGPEFGLVLCLYDSLNYLTDPRELQRALPGFLWAVRPGGLFIFDVNSARRLSQMTETSLFLEGPEPPASRREGPEPPASRQMGPDWAFIEQNHFDPQSSIWEIYVTGFIRHKDGLYKRFREVHRERAYSEKEIRSALVQAGFKVAAAYNAFGFEPASPDAARIYFVAQRPRLTELRAVPR